MITASTKKGTKRGRRRTTRRPTGALQSLASCINCGKPIHSKRNNLGDSRYRERHGWQCPTNGRSTISHRIDWQIAEIIAGIDLAPNWRSRITELVLTEHPIVELKRLAEKRRRVARAYAEGAWSQPEFEARLSEIDAQLSAAEPVESPSMEAISELLDDFPMVWKEATDAERQRLAAPLISRAFIDLDNKRIHAIEPQPAFARLLETAITRTSRSACVLLTADEADRLVNVGLVETGESRTPRPARVSLQRLQA